MAAGVENRTYRVPKPGLAGSLFGDFWIPAFAGMTIVNERNIEHAIWTVLFSDNGLETTNLQDRPFDILPRMCDEIMVCIGSACKVEVSLVPSFHHGDKGVAARVVTPL